MTTEEEIRDWIRALEKELELAKKHNDNLYKKQVIGDLRQAYEDLAPRNPVAPDRNAPEEVEELKNDIDEVRK